MPLPQHTRWGRMTIRVYSLYTTCLLYFDQIFCPFVAKWVKLNYGHKITFIYYIFLRQMTPICPKSELVQYGPDWRLFGPLLGALGKSTLLLGKSTTFKEYTLPFRILWVLSNLNQTARLQLQWRSDNSASDTPLVIFFAVFSN